MSKTNKKLLAIIISLVAIIAFLLYLNKDSVEKSVQIYNNSEIEIYDGDLIKSYNFEEIKSLETHTFQTNLNESGKEPVMQEYTGVLVKDLLENINIDIEKIVAITVSAVDGYTVITDKEKIMDEDNVYLVYMQNGKYLESRGAGGVGPYQVVVSKDQFSQHWCKYVTRIDVVR